MAAATSKRDPLTPLNFAAYVTWLAVLLAVWHASGKLPAVGTVPARGMAVALLCVFVIAFWLIDRAPLVALGTLLASTFGLLMLGPTDTAPVLLIIVAAVAAVRMPPRAAITLIVCANIALFIVLMFRWPRSNAWLVTMIYAGFQCFAAFAAHAVKRANDNSEELQQVNAHLVATRMLLAESARDSERLRLSRELHDVSGHKLTALKLNLAVLAKDASLEQRSELATARTLVDELLHDIRGVVAQLRTHDGIDLREALARLAEPLPFAHVHVQVDEDARVNDAERAAALIRLAQESLTNAAKHASPQNVWLRLTRERDLLQLVVEDDGRLTDPVHPGHGLTGMRERVAALGGELEIGPAQTGGLRICARLPRGRAA